MAALRVGLVGAGMMARNHARVVRACPGLDLVGVADPAGDPGGLAPPAPLVGSVGELLGLGLEAAIVAVPTADHLVVGLELAGAGVPTLMEKPLAADAEQAALLADAFERAGLVNHVGQIERCNPALRALRPRLEAGELGEVYQVATRRQSPFPGRIADVGVVKDLATHDIDLTAWLLQANYRSVSAFTAHKSGRAHEDLVTIAGRMTDGTVVTHQVNWLSPVKDRMTVVTGERGTFVADTLMGDLTFHQNGEVASEWEQVSSFRGVSEGNSIRFAIPKAEPLRVQAEIFRDAVLGVRDDGVTMREGLRTVQVADAVLASGALGRAVELEW